MRGMSAAMIAAIQSGTVRPRVFVEIAFASGTVYLWNGLQPVTWNSQTWQPVGDLGGVRQVDETTGLDSLRLEMVLSGVDPAMLALVLGSVRYGQQAKVYVGAVDAAGAVIVDPVEAFRGRPDAPRVSYSPEGVTVRLSVIDDDNRRRSDNRWTHETQQRFFAGDLGFEHVTAVAASPSRFGGYDSLAERFAEGRGGRKIGGAPEQD